MKVYWLKRLDVGKGRCFSYCRPRSLLLVDVEACGTYADIALRREMRFHKPFMWVIRSLIGYGCDDWRTPLSGVSIRPSALGGSELCRHLSVVRTACSFLY